VNSGNWVLLVDCEDRKGLVYHISSVLYEHDLNIEHNGEFVDKEQNKFFMRTEISGDFDHEKLLNDLLLRVSNASIRLIPPNKKRIVILVTKEAHCLGDLLVRHAFDEFNAEILAIGGNYTILQELSEKFGMTYHHISHEGLDRDAHEAKVIEMLEAYDPDYVVLAKYMRILTPRFVEKFENRIINIHHSFLPAFIGARPYRQAYERGVKIIGATAHFVNNDLDEGPIIAQNVIPVDHSDDADEMARLGRDVEKIVLARALKLVFDDKVLVHGNKTVIFD